MAEDIVSIKGIKDGLLIQLSNTEEWNSITQQLASSLDEKAGFFSGARVTVDVGERPVPKYELHSLKALLERRGMTLMVVRSTSETTLASASALDVRVSLPENAVQAPTLEHETLPIDPEEQGTTGVMIRRTLRSGRTVHSRGHVVVFGDVNPGAKIVAIGDIIVWGKLRGVVHAGAEGDTNAIVCALDMSPNQLRIADLIATSPQGKKRNVRPEVASVRGEQIVVDTWE